MVHVLPICQHSFFLLMIDDTYNTNNQNHKPRNIVVYTMVLANSFAANAYACCAMPLACCYDDRENE